METIASGVGPAKLSIAYERLGHPQDPVILLIQGLGGQLIGWPDGFCSALCARGFSLIRFDNRDAGLSSHICEAPVPDLPAVLGGDLSCVSYTLSDMAADAMGLLDILGCQRVHLLGASMGAAIAQTAAIEYPERVRSLISMMSTTGNLTVGQPAPQILKALFSGPPAQTRQEVIDRYVNTMTLIGSPVYPVDKDLAIKQAARAFDRSYDPLGTARQAIASLASGDRTRKLQSLKVPALVIHGMDDLMCDVSGGQATAAAIPDSQLILIKGMGHNLPAELCQEIAGHIADFIGIHTTHHHK